jgi:malonate decarboxylase epsilon subunit
MSLAFLFPGQGSQRPNMLSALPDSPAIAAVLHEFHSQCTVLGLPEDIDSSAALTATINVQIALLVAGVGCARALTEDYGLAPKFVAGHSVGAFAAAVTAGVLTFTEALAAVALRGRLMQEACANGAWGMAALTGLSARAAAQLADEISTEDDPVWVANVNGTTQTVVSGTAAGLAKAAYAAEAAGATDYEMLNVPVASHCPLQAGTADRLAAHLAQLPRRTPTARYLTNSRGRAVSTADMILDDLAQAVAHPVQWYNAMRLLPELGTACAIETPPGHVLTRLLVSAAPTVTALSVDDDGIGAVTARAARLSAVDGY